MVFNNNIGFKKKVKIVVGVIAISVSLGYLLVGFELNAWNQAVGLGVEIFYQEVPESNLTVPHAKATYQNLIKWTFGKDAKIALAVATAENGTHQCDRVHVNKDGSRDIGIFQINEVHAAKGNLYDCKDNVRVAYEIYKRSGWNPWTVYKTGAYKKHLN